jgi:outer membrane lipoprotein SlyB
MRSAAVLAALLAALSGCAPDYSQTPGKLGGAFGTIGGSLVGGLVGTAVEHTTGDTTAFEYVVRKPNGELLSVTQKDVKPRPLGQKVLVITGNQARIVADYTVAGEPSPPPSATPEAPAGKATVSAIEAASRANTSNATDVPAGSVPDPHPAAPPGSATATPNTAENPPSPSAQQK